jgi:hypothetical protein
MTLLSGSAARRLDRATGAATSLAARETVPRQRGGDRRGKDQIARPARTVSGPLIPGILRYGRWPDLSVIPTGLMNLGVMRRPTVS